MNFKTYEPSPDLASFVKFYWSLEVPKLEHPQKQRIIPDGQIEMIFILGDEVKRLVSEDQYIVQPRAMILGPISEPFYVLPTGRVESFAVSFYPYGFANFVSVPIHELANRETALSSLFEKRSVEKLKKNILDAKDTTARIQCVEHFLLTKLTEDATIDSIVKSTIDALYASEGKTPINQILKNDQSKKKQLERKFKKQVGVNPKQLSKVIRLQAALQMIIGKRGAGKLTDIAYDSGFFDQSHFIKDFKEFTGINPNDFLKDDEMALSTLFYSKG